MLENEFIQSLTGALEEDFGKGTLELHEKGINGSGYMSDRGIFSLDNGNKFFVRISPDGARDYHVLEYLNKKGVSVPETYKLMSNGEKVVEVMEYVDNANILRDLVIGDYKKILQGTPVEQTNLRENIEKGLCALKNLHDLTKTNIFGWSLNDEQRKNEFDYYQGSYKNLLIHEFNFFENKLERAGVCSKFYKNIIDKLGQILDNLPPDEKIYGLNQIDANTSNIFIRNNKPVMFDLDFARYDTPYRDISWFEQSLYWDLIRAKGKDKIEIEDPTSGIFLDVLKKVYDEKFVSRYLELRDYYRCIQNISIMANSYDKTGARADFYKIAKQSYKDLYLNPRLKIDKN